ncbi:DUF4238 domain-containing protein [Pelosinus sp. UFO1]|uniref:DUF4238 domain-containing protein n=1 Tax=Pelosinus sp. UFO1 TaxID=484770 RepID=UPI0004D1DA84|nr:DUF4238 domain-containing protein [Pelosinus sp. UFO1]AIF50221.1 Protein of unknown function DUF4238 [Pelosinus sp. UFO1]
MPLDHYVSQVHLRNFYSQKLEVLMYAIRKTDLKSFKTNSESVCRIEEGNTNLYLQEDQRAVEKFLKGIEPKYNKALEKLTTNNIDQECVYVIAGFVAYVLTCSPAGMRIQSVPLKNFVEETERIIDSQGISIPPPSELGGESLTELLISDKVQLTIDPKYPQAIGIASISSLTAAFGNCIWDVLINPFDDTPFFTSDFPIAIEETEDIRIINRIVPLSPKIAIRIRPNLTIDRDHTDFSFSNFRYAVRKLSRKEVVGINRLIVRCAESVVFFRDDHEWISKFVKKNATFRIEMNTYRMPRGKGTLLGSMLKVVDNKRGIIS